MWKFDKRLGPVGLEDAIILDGYQVECISQVPLETKTDKQEVYIGQDGKTYTATSGAAVLKVYRENVESSKSTMNSTFGELKFVNVNGLSRKGSDNKVISETMYTHFKNGCSET